MAVLEWLPPKEKELQWMECMLPLEAETALQAQKGSIILHVYETPKQPSSEPHGVTRQQQAIVKTTAK
jgi:hypothetical protein